MGDSLHSIEMLHRKVDLSVRMEETERKIRRKVSMKARMSTQTFLESARVSVGSKRERA